MKELGPSCLLLGPQSIPWEDKDEGDGEEHLSNQSWLGLVKMALFPGQERMPPQVSFLTKTPFRKEGAVSRSVL